MENVLTIAGSDSLAGGGVQADLKTFEELNVFGVSALTSLVTVTPTGTQQTNLSAKLLSEQLDSILEQLPINYAKTGLIGDFSNLLVVIKKLMNTDIQLVVDPVLFFKEGRHDFHKIYADAIKNLLLPIGFVTTPNLKEATYLSDSGPLTNKWAVREAAKRIQAHGCSNVVIKCGGHFPGSIAYDYLLDGDQSYWFESPKLTTVTTDGAGCTFSAAITASLANGYALVDAVRFANQFVYLGIKNGVHINQRLGSVWQGAYRQEE